MGSYTELTIDGYPIHSSKSYVPDISCVFCESDKKIFNRKINERNIIVWGNMDNEDLEVAYEYQTTVKIAIKRLEIMGYSLSETKLDFIDSKNQLIKEYSDDEPILNDMYTNEITLLKFSDFNDFIEAFVEIRIKKARYYKIDRDYDLSNLSKYLIDDGSVLNFPFSELGFYYRAFLESCVRDALVIQDITEVVNAGYYVAEEEVIASLMENQEKITILTEGTSDINIISKSIQLLYPYLFDYYNFKDFKISNAQGSAHQLFLDIKNLIAINHKGKVVALFDNDGEGVAQISQLKKISIPENFVVLKYPNITLLESYPTSNNTFQNLNGVAGSIEMYLGKDIIEEQGKFIPIKLSDQKTPQGAIKYKNNLQKKYFKKIKKCQNEVSNINNYDWTEMNLLLNKIFESFKGNHAKNN